MRILKLLLSAFAVGILMTVFVSCEKDEYAQPDRNVTTEQTTGSDRGVTDDGNCDGHGRDGGGCGGGG